MNYLWQKFLVELKYHNRIILDEFSIIYCGSASSTFLHGLSGRNMLNLVRHTNLCIHNSENYMFLWVVLFSCILTLAYQLIVKSSRAFVITDARYSCGPSSHSVQNDLEKQTPVPLPYPGLGQRSCAPQIKLLIQLSFCSTLEYYHL